MRGCLAYFCAEWRRARQLVQLDSEAFYELHISLNTEGDVVRGTKLAFQYGLAGWRLDTEDALQRGCVLDGLLYGGASLATEVSHGSDRQKLSRESSRGGGASSADGHYASRAAASHGDSVGLDASSGHGLGDSLGSTGKPAAGNATNAAASLRRGQVSPFNSLFASNTRMPSRGRAGAAGEKMGPPPLLLFHNPAHALSGLKGDFSREEFEKELRKRLVAERFFASSSHNAQDTRDPILSSDDTEILFEALLMLQQRMGSGNATSLELGRPLDSVVDKLLALTRFRQLMERGAPSPSDFFERLDLDKSGAIEFCELEFFCEDSILANKLFKVLDVNKDSKIELWELRSQVALAAPTRLSLTELVGHYDVKYGLGKCGFTGLQDRAFIYKHLVGDQLLDLSTEDAARVMRAGGGRQGMLNAASFGHFLSHIPLEAAWGVEPIHADRMLHAMGIRLLVMERSRKQDACLPTEAVVLPSEREEALGTSEIEERFGRLWDRCVGDGKSCQSSALKELREGCLRRFRDAAQDGWELRRTGAEARGRSTVPRCVPYSLFANVGDVLAMPSTRLYSGQVAIVRYRLAGASNFLHPSHAVVKNGREPMAWPVKPKDLGNTPFIGLVPRSSTSGSGSCALHGSQAFTRMDASLKVELPRDPLSGLPLVFGYVELTAPSLERGLRSQREGRETKEAPAEEFELRLFCATQQRITGCIGEPLYVTVSRPSLPPPIEALQVRFEGRTATLRWGILDLGAHAPRAVVECVRLFMRSEKAEQTVRLDAEATEWEAPDLAADMQYEFRARLENTAGHGSEVAVVCRTNACCSATGPLQVATVGTAHVELKWVAPKVLGNETTKDRYQQSRERIVCYQATLRVEVDLDQAEVSTNMGWDDDVDVTVPAAGTSRKCSWDESQWKREPIDQVSVKLAGLRPDTRYELEDFCAVNSMGPGVRAKALVFWTIPQKPKIHSVRVRHGMVLVALSQTGGEGVKEYSVSVFLPHKEEVVETFTLPMSELSHKHEATAMAVLVPELSLAFVKMMDAESLGKHTFRLRANNAGGWSEWSEDFVSVAVARQQGAEEAQRCLIRAIEAHRIEELTRTIDDVRDIELPDERYLQEASSLLQTLQSAKAALVESMHLRDPTTLKTALDEARTVKLPDLDKADMLLRKLQAVVQRLASAKGIDQLRMAIRSGEEARLPDDLLRDPVERLAMREAAQRRLEGAMYERKVPGLKEALEASVHMHLPAEADGKLLLKSLQASEDLLKWALRSRLLKDLVGALASAQGSGLREDHLVGVCQDLLEELHQAEKQARVRLQRAVEERHPVHLRQMLAEAREAQVISDHLCEPAALLEQLEHLVRRLEDAVGLAERLETLTAARSALLPAELLEPFEEQYRRLGHLYDSLARGCVEVLRRTLRKAEIAGCKQVEIVEAKVVYAEWDAADRKVEVCMGLGKTERLRVAIEAAAELGIAPDELARARLAHSSLMKRDEAEVRLREAVRHRQLEKLQKALKSSCDNEVADMELLEVSTTLLERLYQLRADVAVALRLGELRTTHAALQTATSHPPLPERELLPLREQLAELQHQEEEHVKTRLQEAIKRKDWRMVDALLVRNRRAQLMGTEIGEVLRQLAQKSSSESQAEDRRRFATHLQRERSVRDYRGWTDDVPVPRERVPVPSHTVTGELTITFEPSGLPLYVLPREIVEATVVVYMEDEAERGEVADITVGNAAMTRLILALKRMLPPGDEVLSFEKQQTVIDDEGGVIRRDPEAASRVINGVIQRDVAVYVRGRHSGMDVADGVTARSALGRDVWQCGELSEKVFKDQSIPALSSSIASSLVKGLLVDTVPLRAERPRCLADNTRHVVSRILRRVTLELSWRYPRGLMDTLDPCCIVFDEENLVEIVDHRGYQGSKYDAWLRDGDEERPSVIDNTQGAIKHGGSQLDHEGRRGKQLFHIRLDLMPSRITDFVFILSTSNSRDLGKFSEIRATFYDTDTMHPLCSTEVPQAAMTREKESVVICSVYRLADSLWRVNAFGTAFKGTVRDYCPFIGKLAELGFPRIACLRQQVPAVLASLERQFKVDPAQIATTATSLDSKRNSSKSSKTEEAVAVASAGMKEFPGIAKEVGVTVVPRSEAHPLKPALVLRYAVELFGAPEERRSTMASQPSSKLFHRELLRALQAANSTEAAWSRSKNVFRPAGERFTDNHLAVGPAEVKTLHHVELRMRWKRPSEDRFRDDLNLDGTCAIFEEQGLREIVDYRGPHGVRIVQAGVLDYGGIWLGNLGVSDASGGAVWNEGESTDDVAHSGSHSLRLRFDKLPKSASDLFVCLSSPTEQDISIFDDVHMVMVDAENPAHEIARCNVVPTENSAALVLCCLSSEEGAPWRLDTFGSRTLGNAIDYRPMIHAMRSMQAERYNRDPQWPSKSPGQVGQEFGTLSSQSGILGSKLPRAPEKQMLLALVDEEQDAEDKESLHHSEPKDEADDSDEKATEAGVGNPHVAGVPVTADLTACATDVDDASSLISAWSGASRGTSKATHSAAPGRHATIKVSDIVTTEESAGLQQTETASGWVRFRRKARVVTMAARLFAPGIHKDEAPEIPDNASANLETPQREPTRRNTMPTRERTITRSQTQGAEART